MKASRWLWLLALSLAVACNIYDQQLIDSAEGDSAETGGTGSGGDPGDGGEPGDGGTDGSGGSDSGGGGTGSGGDEPSGGSGGDTGGSDSGGGSSGSGGSGTGGTEGGGGSTGGTPSVLDLVDDLSSETLIYNHAPFFGTWTRYAQTTGITWIPAAEDGMVADDGGNFALHVHATFTVDDWGIDVVLPLQESGGTYSSYDISEYTGVRFRARRADGYSALKVSLEDEASHRGSTLCVAGTGGSAGYVGEDCDNHAVAPSVGLTTSWKEFYVPLTSFSTGVSGPRDEPLDATKVYAIHFQMNPPAATPLVDFWLDDIYLATYE